MTFQEVLFEIAFCFSIIGICLTIIFLTILLLTTSDTRIEYYRYSIAQNCFFDLLFALSSVFLKMDAFIYNGYFITVINAFNYEVSNSVTQLLVSAVILTCGLSILCPSVPFAIRYLIICKSCTLTVLKLLLLYIPHFTCILIFLIGWNSLVVPSSSDLSDIQMKPYLLPNTTGRYWNFVAVNVSNSSLLYFLFFFIQTSVTVSIITSIFFNMKVFKELKDHRFSAMDRSAYYGLQKIMILQSIIQIFFAAIPVSLMGTSLVLDIKSVSHSFCMIKISPVLMTMCTVLSISQYRDKLKGIIYYFIFIVQ